MRPAPLRCRAICLRRGPGRVAARCDAKERRPTRWATWCSPDLGEVNRRIIGACGVTHKATGPSRLRGLWIAASADQAREGCAEPGLVSCTGFDGCRAIERSLLFEDDL